MALRKKAAAAVASVTAAHQDTQDLLMKLQAEISSAQSAAEQQSSAYAAFINQDALADSGDARGLPPRNWLLAAGVVSDESSLMTLFSDIGMKYVSTGP